jgi:hypothetical protein
MGANKHKCKLCGKNIGLGESENARWCEDCREGMELISYLKENLLPITEETILNNIERFMTEPSIERFIFNSDGMERYMDLNYSLEQYERIKNRSMILRRKLKID